MLRILFHRYIPLKYKLLAVKSISYVLIIFLLNLVPKILSYFIEKRINIQIGKVSKLDILNLNSYEVS